jgi:hypothetical protein
MPLYASGDAVDVTPGSSTDAPVNILYAQWLNKGESPTTPDGPMNVGAVLASIAAGGSVSISAGTVDIGTIPAISLASGTTVDVTGSVDAKITNASITVAGGVDATITNASLTVSGSVTADISNATLNVAGTVDATLTGPVGISQGSTINVVNSAAGGQTPLSSTTTTTTANATLDSTNYVLVALPSANGLPAGSSGNLVYDSNLTQAIASVGATWNTSGVTIGTSEGDWNINNAGTDQAELVYYGTGSAPSGQYWGSQYTDVTPGITYTFSTLVNATNLTNNGGCYIAVRTSSGSQESTNGISNGFSGVLSSSYTPASGVNQIQFFINWGGTVAAGDTVTFSQIQLTQTSTVQPYQPGPLFNNIAFKEDGNNFYKLGETTALALKDTGQPLGRAQPSTSVNSSYNPRLPAPDAPTLTVEGTAGTTTATYGWVTQTTSAQGVVVVTNEYINVQGVSGGESVGTHVSSSPDNGTASVAIASASYGPTGSITIDVPVNTRSVYFASSISSTLSGSYFVLKITGSTTGIIYYDEIIATGTSTDALGGLFPINSADTSLDVAYTQDFYSETTTTGTLTIDYYVEFSGTIIPLPPPSPSNGLTMAQLQEPANSSSGQVELSTSSSTLATGPCIVRSLSWYGLGSGDQILWQVSGAEWGYAAVAADTTLVNWYIAENQTLTGFTSSGTAYAAATITTL